MKETLISVILFCLILAAVTAVCTFSYAVSLIGSRLSLYPVITPAMLVTLIPAALRQMFLPATLLSLFLTLVRARRKPQLVFISYLLLGALAFGVLFLGPQLVSGPLEREIAKVKAAAVVSPRDLEQPRKLIALKDSVLYFERREGQSLRSVVTVDQTRPAPRIEFYDSAAVRTGPGRTRLDLSSPAGGASRAIEFQDEEASLFAPEASVRSLLGFFQAINERFLSLVGKRTTESLVACLLFTALVLSASFFLRATRWPLANIFITLLVLAGVLMLYNFLVYQLLDEVKKVTGGSALLAAVPYLLLGFFSVLFFLLDFVLLREQRQEPPSA